MGNLVNKQITVTQGKAQGTVRYGQDLAENSMNQFSDCLTSSTPFNKASLNSSFLTVFSM